MRQCNYTEDQVCIDEDLKCPECSVYWREYPFFYREKLKALNEVEFEELEVENGEEM